MNEIKSSRRAFLGGIMSLSAWSAAHGAANLGKPKLKFGVVTDIHFAACGNDTLLKDWNTDLCKKAFTWFRDQKVDAVMCAGDIADRSTIDEMRAFANTWYSVFPRDRRPDGTKVEKIFVTGNHDDHGHTIYKGLPKIWPDEAERNRHIFARHRVKVWEELFHEPYQSIYMKKVNGYVFIGNMFEHPRGMEGVEGVPQTTFGQRLAALLKERGEDIDPKKPFFYVQHPHPKNTCYGPWAWGHDDGKVTEILNNYPNAVAFSGHSHYSLADERSIWQGGFTSIGCSSLRYFGPPNDEFAKNGRMHTYWQGIKWFAQGLLVSVYDDCIVYERHEFMEDQRIGEDWVQSVTLGEPREFAFEERAKKFRAPIFQKGASVGIKREADGGAVLTIPATIPHQSARCWVFEAVFRSADGKEMLKRFMAEGAEMSEHGARAKMPTVVKLKKDELPPEPWTVEVTPVSCFGKRGAPLKA